MSQTYSTHFIRANETASSNIEQLCKIQKCTEIRHGKIDIPQSFNKEVFTSNDCQSSGLSSCEFIRSELPNDSVIAKALEKIPNTVMSTIGTGENAFIDIKKEVAVCKIEGVFGIKFKPSLENTLENADALKYWLTNKCSLSAEDCIATSFQCGKIQIPNENVVSTAEEYDLIETHKFESNDVKTQELIGTAPLTQIFNNNELYFTNDEFVWKIQTTNSEVKSSVEGATTPTDKK